MDAGKKMKTINEERFDKASERLKEIRKKHPKIVIAEQIGLIDRMLDNPLSPVYDDEYSYNHYLKRLEILLEQL